MILHKNKFLVALVVICSIFFVIESHQAKQVGTIEEDEFKSLMTSVGFKEITIDSISKKPIFSQEDFLKFNSLTEVVHKNITHESGNCILYDLTLHTWIKIFGFSLYTLRMLSLLFAVGIIIIAFYLSDSLFNNKNTALLSSALLACDPSILCYGTRVRTYAMATFLSLLATLLFVKWIKSIDKNDKKKLFTNLSVAYGTIAGLAVLAHYFCFYILLIHFIFLIPHLLKASIKNKLGLILPYVVLSLIVGTWIYIGGLEGFHYIAKGNEWHLSYAKGANKLTSMTQLTTIDNTIAYIKKTALAWSYNETYWYYFRFNIPMRYLLILFAIPVIFICSALFYLWRKKQNGIHLFYFLILLFLVGPSICIFLAFQSGHTASYNDRYALMSLPYFTIVLAYGISQLYNNTGFWKNTSVGLCIILAVNIVTTQKIYFDDIALQFKPHFQILNDSVQKQLKETANFKNKMIEFPYPYMALKFNLSLSPTHRNIKQTINYKIERNKIYLIDTITKKKSVLYEFPKDYNAVPVYHSE